MTIQALGELAEISINLPGRNHCNAPGHFILKREVVCTLGQPVVSWEGAGHSSGHTGAVVCPVTLDRLTESCHWS